MRANGFQMMGLKRHHWKMHDGQQCGPGRGGRLIFGDALYLNRRAFARCDAEFAIKAILVMRRYGLHDVADHLSAAHWIDPADLSKSLAAWDRTGALPAEPESQPHQDRGTIVEFDDAYGF